MRTKHVVVILILLAVGLLPSPAQAGGVVAVCDEAHLLAALAGGGLVTFACSGTIVLTNTITVAADTTIDGAGHEVTISGNDALRVLTVQEGAALSLNALTVAHGRSDNGGGVHNSGALTVTNSVFTGNSAGNGGAIFIPTCYADCGDIPVTVSNSTFSANSASEDGGGIFISPYCYDNCGQMAVTVAHSVFAGNSARAGAGIFHDGDYGFQNVTLTVSHSAFATNTAGNGSAIFSGHGTTLRVSDSAFSHNSGACIATDIYSTAALWVSHSAFSDNSSHGIRNAKWNDLTVRNSGFYRNGGCGIDNYDASVTVSDSAFVDNGDCGIANGDDNGTATVANSTFSNNGGDGGDIDNFFLGAAVVSNSTFHRTKAGHGGGIYNGVEARLTMINSTLQGVPVINSEWFGTLTLKNTIVANNLTGSNCTGVIVDGGGNLSYPDASCPGINADPLLGPLQDNGGPTLTMEPGPGSPAIDAGEPAACAAAPVDNLDQRGVARPVGPRCDMGAVEVNYLPVRTWLPLLLAQ